MKILMVVLRPATTELEVVVIHASGVSRVQQSPFNTVAIDTMALQNTTKSLSDALSQLPGMKLRESGGMGSDMQLMLDCFSGKHVKVFIVGQQLLHRQLGARVRGTTRRHEPQISRR